MFTSYQIKQILVEESARHDHKQSESFLLIIADAADSFIRALPQQSASKETVFDFLIGFIDSMKEYESLKSLFDARQVVHKHFGEVVVL